MTDKDRNRLKDSMKEAELENTELDDVAGGAVDACGGSCEPGCSPSCQPGNSGGTEIQ